VSRNFRPNSLRISADFQFGRNITISKGVNGFSFWRFINVVEYSDTFIANFESFYGVNQGLSKRKTERKKKSKDRKSRVPAVSSSAQGSNKMSPLLPTWAGQLIHRLTNTGLEEMLPFLAKFHSQ
jgi:hypothetical protein